MRMKLGRRAAALFILCAAQGCSVSGTGSISSARFELVHGQGDSRRTVTRLEALRSMSVALSERELGDGAQVCLGDLEGRLERMGYDSDERTRAVRTEAHVYLRDPNEVHDTLASMTDDDIVNGRWAEELASPQDRPHTLVMPFPLPAPFTGSAYQVPLGPVYYPAWGPGGASRHYVQAHPAGYQCRPLAPPQTPGAGHAVRGLALYDRGLCESSVDLSSVILPQLLTQTRSRISEGLHKAGAITVRRRYNTAASYVRFDGPDVKGGLFWAFHFIANSETHLWGNYRLEYGLSPMGVPAVGVREVAYHTTGGMAPTWGEWIRNGSPLNKPLATELADGFEGVARPMLTFSSRRLGSDAACSTDDTPQTLAARCEVAARDLAIIAVPDSAAGPDGVPLTAEARTRQRCAIGDSAACAAVSQDASAIRARRWACGEAPKDSKQGVCQFVIPVKRLNPMPDSLRLVFFDTEDEHDNAALAMWRLAGQQMCQPPEPVPADLLQGPFKVLLRTPASASVEIDPWPT